MSVTVKSVVPHSPAHKAGVVGGDILLSINSHEIRDVLDYRFYMLEPTLSLAILRNGQELTLTLQKDEYDDPGMEFDTYLMDAQKGCKNKCIFCFIDQLPKGMRKSLYFKDDDSRLSFLFGNYITLTNLTEQEVERIIKMHISPINISVHTTNPDLRVEMMKNPHAGKVLSIMKQFADAGISMNCQLVLCPDINDRGELEHSLKDLGELYPAVQSIAAVPVGVTKHREGLAPLSPFTKEQAVAVVDCMEAFGNAFLEKHGTRLCYPADEFYLKAGRPLPNGEFYEEYAQIENGVGMWTSFLEEFQYALKDQPKEPINRTVSMVTGKAAYPLIARCAKEAEENFSGLTCHVYAIENHFFGEHITVTGLLTGQDVIAQVKGKPLGETLLLPACTLRREGDMMLDDTTPQQLEETLGVPVTIVPDSGEAFLSCLLGQ